MTRISIHIEDIGPIVAEDLIWMHQHADEMTDKEVEAVEVVLAWYLTRDQSRQFYGEEV